MNSLKTVFDSIELYLLLYNITGNMLTNKIKPVWDLLVNLLDECYVSTNVVIDCPRPCGLGIIYPGESPPSTSQ